MNALPQSCGGWVTLRPATPASRGWLPSTQPRRVLRPDRKDLHRDPGEGGTGGEAGDGTHASQPSGTVWSRPRMLRPARLPPCPPGAVPPAAVDSSPFVSCPLRFGPNPAAPSRCEDEAARRGQEPASLYGDRGQWAAGSAQVPGSLLTRATRPTLPV